MKNSYQLTVRSLHYVSLICSWQKKENAQKLDESLMVDAGSRMRDKKYFDYSLLNQNLEPRTQVSEQSETPVIIYS